MKRFLYKIKDNYSDTRAKYKECLTYIVYEDIPQKYINTKIPYRHSYYFTIKEDRDNFLDELIKRHKAKEQITQEYLNKHKQDEEKTFEEERKDTLYEIVEHWLQHIESEEQMHEICEEIMKLDCHDFADNIEVINKHLGDLNEDGDFDGVAMEIEEWFADNGENFSCNEKSNRKYMIECNDKNDLDNQIIQSNWFDTEKEAKDWLKTLDFLNTQELVVWLMSSEFDENGDYTDIDFEEDLTNETRKGER